MIWAIVGLLMLIAGLLINIDANVAGIRKGLK